MSGSRKDSLFHGVRVGESPWPGSEEAVCFLATRGSKTMADQEQKETSLTWILHRGFQSLQTESLPLEFY